MEVPTFLGILFRFSDAAAAVEGRRVTAAAAAWRASFASASTCRARAMTVCSTSAVLYAATPRCSSDCSSRPENELGSSLCNAGGGVGATGDEAASLGSSMGCRVKAG